MRIASYVCMTIAFFAGFLVFDSVLRLHGKVPNSVIALYVGLLIVSTITYLLTSSIADADDEMEDRP